MDASGNLLVNIKAGAGSGGTAITDEAAFTQGTTSFTPAGCFFNGPITNLSIWVKVVPSAAPMTGPWLLRLLMPIITDRQYLLSRPPWLLPAIRQQLRLKQRPPRWQTSPICPVATGPVRPTKSDSYLGANASGATGGLTRGLINCDNHVFKYITSATDTLAVQGVAGQTIYVCGWRSRAAGTATCSLRIQSG